MAEGERGQLRRALGLGDVVLVLVITGVNLQWVATASAGGPGALVVWFVALGIMYLPLALSVTELSTRYPDEGGLYVWSKRAFGDFGGFMTGWTYWMSNLPYFPTVLYFAAGSALFVGGERFRALGQSGTYFVVFSILGLSLATALNVAGLGAGKWLTNIGAVCQWLATLVLVVLGALSWGRFGSATAFTPASLVPGAHLKDLVFWSTIVFALTGLESASFMGGEIRNAPATVKRGILLAAPVVTLVYVLGTASVLVALPHDEATRLQGIMQAVVKAADRLALPGAAPLAALLLTVGALGCVGAWLAAVARIPFVAGIDHALPESFGRLHPRWGSPHVSLLAQALVTLVVIVLGQAGTSVRGAYDALVSMTIIAYFIPYLALFASAIRLRRSLAALPVPALGLATTTACIVLSLFPPEAEPRKVLAVVKVVGLTLVMVGSGVVAYLLRPTRSRATPGSSP